MDKTDVKDTTAYAITRQIMDHIYGSDEELDETGFFFVSREFGRLGGSWESLMTGSMSSVKKLEDAIAYLVNCRRMLDIASRVAGTISDE